MKKLIQNFYSDLNLWPLPHMEAWKYFDLKSFKKATESLQVEETAFKIEFDNLLKDEIRIEDNILKIASNLKSEFKMISLESFSYLNKKTKLDLRISEINKISPLLCLKAESIKKKLKLIYSCKNKNSIFKPSLRFDFSNCEIEIMEEYGEFDCSLFSIHTQFLLQDTKIKHIILQSNEAKKSIGFHTNEVQLIKTSDYKSYQFSLKMASVRNQISLSIESEKSCAEILGVNISDGNDFSETRTEMSHWAPHCNSRQIYKTIASEKSKSIFSGRIYVDRLAQKTDSSQLCQGLLLSPDSEINAKPELEIFADDVKAAHGAAIGQLGKEQIFYLLSRGIKKEKAYELLAAAFAGEVINEIENLDDRNYISSQVEKTSTNIFDKLVESFTQS